MRRFVAALFIPLTLAAVARATTYASYHNREIIVEADVVVAGKIVRIVAPTFEKDAKTVGCSVAFVRVETVFKGDVKPGVEIGFVYWSHSGDGGDRHDWKLADQYKVDETLVLPLRKRGERFDRYILPKEAAQAKWIPWSPRGIYDEQIQGAEFRRVAETWVAPDERLKDPKRCADAAFFLAHQKRLPEKTLLKLLQSKDEREQHAGCLAAELMRNNAALDPLVAIVEKYKRFWARWNAADSDERERLADVRQLYIAVRNALGATPINGANDGPALLRLVLCGEMDESMIYRLLRSGDARWHVRRGWRESQDEAILLQSLRVLQALDARAAYEPIKSFVIHRENRYRLRSSLAAYQTAWAQRFVLERASDLDGGHGVVEQYYLVRGCFGFTHGSLEKLVAKEWDASYAELRQKAEIQLALTEKKGPNFAELPARLEATDKWEVHRVGASAFIQLSKSQQKELAKLLVQHADAKAVGLDANVDAAWLVDLYDPNYGRYQHGQLWVAEDGTFGFGWLPDRAWGKSLSIPAFLKKPPR